MDINYDTIRQLNRLNAINRYNTHQRIKDETVASHSFFVSLFVKMINQNLDFKNETVPTIINEIERKSLMLAIVHDVSETVTNDITYDAKKAMPEVGSLLDRYDSKYLEEFFPQEWNMVYGYNKNSYTSKVARDIVKLADILSVVQYLDNEVNLGNQTMRSPLFDSIERVKSMIVKIREEHGIVCQKIII